MKRALLLFSAFTMAMLTNPCLAQRVGIGTTQPTARLEIAAPDSGVLIVTNTQTLNTDVDNGIFFKTGGRFTGAVKTTGQTNLDARLGLFTFSDGNPFTLKERLSILDNGNVGINTTAPTANFDVNGTLRIRGGSPGAGKVLTSDANGNASWQAEPVVAFRAAGLLDNVALPLVNYSWVKVMFAQVPQYNYGQGYSGLSGNFEAPHKGIYHFNIRTDFQNEIYEVHMRLMQKRGNSTWEAAYIQNIANSTSGNGVIQLHNMNISTDLLAEAGDAFWVEVYIEGNPNTKLSPAARANWFSARLVQPL